MKAMRDPDLLKRIGISAVPSIDKADGSANIGLDLRDVGEVAVDSPGCVVDRIEQRDICAELFGVNAEERGL